MQVLDQDQDAGAGVGSADADVVQAAGDAQGDDASLVDAVGAYSLVGVGAGCWVGFGSGAVGGGGGSAVPGTLISLDSMTVDLARPIGTSRVGVGTR